MSLSSVRVALKLRSLRFHSPRLCRIAVFLIQTNVSQTNVSLLPLSPLQPTIVSLSLSGWASGGRHTSFLFSILPLSLSLARISGQDCNVVNSIRDARTPPSTIQRCLPEGPRLIRFTSGTHKYTLSSACDYVSNTIHDHVLLRLRQASHVGREHTHAPIHIIIIAPQHSTVDGTHILHNTTQKTPRNSSGPPAVAAFAQTGPLCSLR